MSEKLDILSEGFDDFLLRILKEGREIMDRDGNVQRVELTAADLNVIRQRLKDCGITAVPMSNNPIGHILEEMKSRNVKMPPISMEDDVATA
tara:strand:- start:1018 stop:1293 length:276 start_codon:yes stop_codon:yes gene_type:complete